MNKRWLYFTDQEAEGINVELMAGLDRARHRAGIPFVITSARRSAEENTQAGGVADSAHVTGHALDFRATDSGQVLKIVRALLHEGFKRIVIGINPEAKDPDGFYHNIHVDNDPGKPDCLAIKIYKVSK